MTHGEWENHPFTAALRRWAPDFVNNCSDDIPDTYPHPRAIQAIKARQDSVQSRVILERQAALRMEVTNWKQEADRTAKILRMAALKNRAFARWSYLKSEAVKRQVQQEKDNFTKLKKPSVHTQTTSTPEDVMQTIAMAMTAPKFSVHTQTVSSPEHTMQAPTKENEQQCPDEGQQILTPQMMADEAFFEESS